MRQKIMGRRSYLFFWFFPLLLLPFTWVNAIVQGAEVLGLIQGSGFLVARNFPTLTIFYLLVSVSLLIPRSLINNYNWKLIYFSCMLIFTSMFALLPRMIIGPTGLSQSGLKDLSDYSAMYFLTIRPLFYLAAASFIVSVIMYLFAELRRQDRQK